MLPRDAPVVAAAASWSLLMSVPRFSLNCNLQPNRDGDGQTDPASPNATLNTTEYEPLDGERTQLDARQAPNENARNFVSRERGYEASFPRGSPHSILLRFSEPIGTYTLGSLNARGAVRVGQTGSVRVSQQVCVKRPTVEDPECSPRLPIGRRQARCSGRRSWRQRAGVGAGTRARRRARAASVAVFRR